MDKPSSQWTGDLPGYRRAIPGKIAMLGIALIVCGAVAVAGPAILTMAVALFLGLVLAAGGIVKIIQSFLMRESGGFAWQLLAGTIELLGGLLVYFNPLRDAIAITVVIALVLAADGLAQPALRSDARATRRSLDGPVRRHHDRSRSGTGDAASL